MTTAPSRLIRRTHMYLALFLTPWMIINALSGLVLNHCKAVRGWEGGKYAAFEKIAARLRRPFSADATPHQIRAQVLALAGGASTMTALPLTV